MPASAGGFSTTVNLVAVGAEGTKGAGGAGAKGGAQDAGLIGAGSGGSLRGQLAGALGVVVPDADHDRDVASGGVGAGAPGARPDKLGAGALLTAIPLARLGSWISSAGRLAFGVAVCGVGGVGGCGVCG